MPTILSVNRVHADIADGTRGRRTAIDKRPVGEPVRVGELGVEGDRQLDTRHHGGRDKAVYAYAAEDLRHWSAELGRDLPPGFFGENLTLAGLDITHAVIGEQWRLGQGDLAPVVEVTMPRIPCATFQRRMQEPHWVRRFTEHGAPGAYLRVVRVGVVAAGATVSVVRRPDHGATVLDAFDRDAPEAMQALLDAAADGRLDLAPAVRDHAERVVGRDRSRLMPSAG